MRPTPNSTLPGAGRPTGRSRRLYAPAATAAVAVVALPLALYLITLCPGAYPGDSGELIAAAWCFGVPHPTGYPLFTVVGGLWQHALWFLEPALGMNLLCALFGAAGAWAAWRLIRELWRHVLGRGRARRPPVLFLSAASAIAAAVGATWWGHANQTEVYGLAIFFVALAWTQGLRLLRRPSERGIHRLAFLSGVALLHHLLFLVTFPLSAIAVLHALRSLRSKPTAAAAAAAGHTAEPEHGRVLLTAALLFLLPLLGYGYIPLRASAEPPVNWGDARGLGGIVWHLSARQYAGTRVLTRPDGKRMAADEMPAHVGRRLGQTLRWLGSQIAVPPALGGGEERATPAERARAPLLGFVLALLALAGFAVLWATPAGRLAATGLALGAIVNLAVTTLYTIADIEVYRLPLWLLTAAVAPVGAIAAPRLLLPRLDEHETTDTDREALARLDRDRRYHVAGAVALLLALCTVAGYRHPSLGVNKRDADGASEYARDVMERLEPDAVVFTQGDYDIYPLWYAQVCEGLRRDVGVVGANFVFNRWYTAMLRVTLPEGVAVFVGDEPPPDRGRWLVAFLGGMVAPQLTRERPVYMTFFADSPDLPTIASKLNLDVVAEYGAVTPLPDAPPLLLCRVRDRASFAAQARQTFLEQFPDGTLRMVHGRRQVEPRAE